MLLTVSKVSEVTSNGNVILSLTNEEVVKTPFGNKTAKRFFCNAVDAEDAPEVGFEAEININDYNVVMRPLPADEEGVVATLPWLHLK